MRLSVRNKDLRTTPWKIGDVVNVVMDTGRLSRRSRREANGMYMYDWVSDGGQETYNNAVVNGIDENFLHIRTHRGEWLELHKKGLREVIPVETILTGEHSIEEEW